MYYLQLLPEEWHCEEHSNSSLSRRHRQGELKRLVDYRLVDCIISIIRAINDLTFMCCTVSVPVAGKVILHSKSVNYLNNQLNMI